MGGGSGLAARLYLRSAATKPASPSRHDRMTILAWVATRTKEIIAQRAAARLLPTIQSGGCRLCLR